MNGFAFCFPNAIGSSKILEIRCQLEGQHQVFVPVFLTRICPSKPRCVDRSFLVLNTVGFCHLLSPFIHQQYYSKKKSDILPKYMDTASSMPVIALIVL